MLAVPLYSLQVLDRVLTSGSLDTLLFLTLIVGAALLFMAVLQVFRSLVFNHIGRWLDDRLSSWIASTTVERTIQDPGLGNQPLRDLNSVRSFVTSPHFATLFDAPWAFIYFTVIYVIHVNLGMLVTAGAILLLILALIAERIPSKAIAAANEEQIKAMQSFDAIVRNAEVVQSMDLLKNTSSKWSQHNQLWLTHIFAANNMLTVITQITRALRLALQVMTMCFGAYFALSNEISPGAIIAVSILTARALSPFDSAAPLYQNVTNVKKALSRLYELETHYASRQLTTTLPNVVGKLTLQKVTLESQVPNRWILKGINIEVGAGEAIGVIGPSGSGKTSLARVIVGVMRPTTGAVRLDGATLQQWDRTQLGEAIGYLPQSVELFDGTIFENIARMDSHADDQAVIEAANAAQVHDAILSYPRGYNTPIGPNGSLLSAGQRQRIALARCFYGSPKLIVLDEPNSNLDGEGDIAFLKALEHAKSVGISTVTIAHRPSVLQVMDKVLVLQDGEAKLFGPTKEVVATLSAGSAKIQSIQSAVGRGNQ